jgi:hypothetical protein
VRHLHGMAGVPLRIRARSTLCGRT